MSGFVRVGEAGSPGSAGSGFSGTVAGCSARNSYAVSALAIFDWPACRSHENCRCSTVSCRNRFAVLRPGQANGCPERRANAICCSAAGRLRVRQGSAVQMKLPCPPAAYSTAMPSEICWALRSRCTPTRAEVITMAKTARRRPWTSYASRSRARLAFARCLDLSPGTGLVLPLLEH